MTKLIKSFFAAIVFYTIIPLPREWADEFERIARWTPLIGLLLGGLLGAIDLCLYWLELPVLTRSVLLVAIWIGITGGLHLDGAIDTADGLAVPDRQRSLEVMKDSVVGAYGAIAAVIIILLKTASLSEIQSYRWLGLTIAAGWGRWGQVIAIAFYPYLRPSGKGRFHKENLRFPQDVLLGLVFLLGLSLIQILLNPHDWYVAIAIIFGGFTAIAIINWYFNRKLAGHTGDTYGAVVEWTEALLLCLFASFFHS